ncbi:biotin--[acetyl-CoA-carboxylase] ligase [Geosporobacter ferrireducens]|uniref:Bifunctional ligase/repressor BirA n=1 Tax=Geosporobacter ferrireducens TaxID=1424294 RepID=A0A1D8GQH6_9FIRM|nr:biotin--[acetyl-CoA-carboxylase] ligase [Geosporobacter ferrireducens]AOT73177.1 biotin--[acetyl-CoA-carboxylase] ligase [Geosporobacter ferrireducens]
MKKEILEALKQNKGKFISGEELSIKIGVTRTAIWKHIKQMKEDGYDIDAVSRRGYRLIQEPDTLELNELQIDMKTRLIGSNLIYYPSIDSTNNEAKKEAAAGAPEGTVIIADEQTGGRGRLGRQWVSPKGTGIWMSIILKPELEPAEAAKITQLTAASVATALRNVTGCEAGIKWPNDIIINKKKVCGILTEMSAELNSVNHIIVGMGINVNVDPEEFPEEVRSIATSVKESVGHEIYRKEIVLEILRIFEDLYLDFIRRKSIDKSVGICRKYSVTLGNQVRIISKDKVVYAEAVDLTEDGELLIRNEAGEIEKIISGEVSVRGVSDYI